MKSLSQMSGEGQQMVDALEARHAELHSPDVPAQKNPLWPVWLSLLCASWGLVGAIAFGVFIGVPWVARLVLP